MQIRRKSKHGYLYVVSCSLYRNGADELFKVGFTTRQKKQLLYRYRNTLIDPEILAWFPVSEPRRAEAELFSKLDSRYVRVQNEIFTGPFEALYRDIKAVSDKYKPTETNFEQELENAFRKMHLKAREHREKADREMAGNIFKDFSFDSNNI